MIVTTIDPTIAIVVDGVDCHVLLDLSLIFCAVDVRLLQNGLIAHDASDFWSHALPYSCLIFCAVYVRLHSQVLPDSCAVDVRLHTQVLPDLFSFSRSSGLIENLLCR